MRVLIGEYEVVEVESSRGRAANEFVELPFNLYRDSRQWVPWFRADVRRVLDRTHPFFRHSCGAFYLVRKGGAAVGRIAALENRVYNAQHGRKSAHFYLYDVADDLGAASALFEAARTWARNRGLDCLLGPMGFGGMTGGGILIEGFAHRAAMTMMAYNHPYYRGLLESLGFEKFLDLHSAYLKTERFQLPDRVRDVARRVLARGSFRVLEFRSKRALKKIAFQIGRIFNVAEAGNLETYAYSDEELKLVIQDLVLVADPSLIKVLAYRDEIVGFLLGFPDLSEAIQRSQGKINPLSLLRILREYGKTDWLIVNGAGILPRYQRLGGNALLYYELERTAKSKNFKHVDMAQIAETTGLMLNDIETLGGQVYKTHRIYTTKL